MRQLLFVLLVLVLSVPAFATVFVYNIKDTDTGIYYSDDEWSQYKDPYQGYFIVGPSSTEGKVEIWAIWTWKDKMGLHYWTEDRGDVNLVQADIPAGKKTKWMWVISDVNDQYRTLLTGEMKVKKVGSAKSATCLNCHSAGELATLGDIDPNIPATLAGYEIWDYSEGDPITSRDLYTSTMKLTFNSKKTLENHVLYQNMDATSVKDELESELDAAGYH
ncbi:MAG: hypothetical protein ABSH16_09515 [Sedimentisphaerales bacterium]